MTVYVEAPVKSCAAPESGETVPPLSIIVGTRAVTLVPKGTFTEILFPLITPEFPSTEKAVMVFSELNVTGALVDGAVTTL